MRPMQPALVLALLVFVLGMQAGEAKDVKVALPSKNRYIVTMEQGTDVVPIVMKLIQGDENPFMQSFQASDYHTFEVGKKPGILFSGTEQAVQAVRSSRGVENVEEDEPIHAAEDNHNYNWALDRVDQAKLPLDSSYEPDYTGAGQFIYILDSGVRSTHEEFEDGHVVQGWDFVENDAQSRDENGHGTHTASMAAGKTLGVAPGATLISVRVLDSSGAGYVSDVISALSWVVSDSRSRRGGCVASLSLGGRFHQTLNEYVNAAVDAGVLIVAAAGNYASDACSSSPASAQRAITVGSTNLFDEIAWFSNTGDCVDMYAPGTDLRGASHESDRSTWTRSGTSMSAPIVAGVLAQLLEKHGGDVNQAIEELYEDAIQLPYHFVQIPRSDDDDGDDQVQTSILIADQQGDEFEAKLAHFGPQDGTIFVSGNLSFDSNHGCKPYNDDKARFHDEIVLVTRANGCTYFEKALNLQNAGASAVIIHDNVNQQELRTMKPHGKQDGSQIAIPVVFVSKATGADLRDQASAVSLGHEQSLSCPSEDKGSFKSAERYCTDANFRLCIPAEIGLGFTTKPSCRMALNERAWTEEKCGKNKHIAVHLGNNSRECFHDNQSFLPRCCSITTM